jgi:eukaryotic-like serine/threonine-protein kinase
MSVEPIEGESLAARLARGPLDLPEALTLGIAIADSLDKAHKQGVVHGGLNPAVVMLPPAGPKLLDFGLTKPAATDGPVDPMSLTPTRTSLHLLSAVPTSAAPYLAPEQLAGGPIDARTDIFAFGALLYEIVTGVAAFREKTQALLIAAVQTVEPEPPSKVQPGVPPALEYVIARCLSKDPKQRLQTAFDVMTELQWILARGGTVNATAPSSATRKKRDRAIWAGLAVASVIALALTPVTFARFRPAPEPELVRFVAANLPTGTTPLTVSPDGRWVTSSFNAGATVGQSLDSVTAQTLIGGTPFQPFWSPDSRSMAYFDQSGKLMRADIGGGPPQIIAEAHPPFSSGAWNRDGVILFPDGGLIQRVLAAGGQPTPITSLDPANQETEHLAPVFLPDGRHYLFLAVSSQPAKSAVYVGSLDSTERKRLFAVESKTVYAAPGYLVFNRGDTVFAQAFDADALSLQGEPIRVASGVSMLAIAAQSRNSKWAAFAVSQTGVLAYRVAGSTSSPVAAPEEQRSLFWFNRTGERIAAIATPGGYASVDLAPDGKRVAVHRHQGGTGGDAWFFDVAQGRMQRLTFDPTQENASPIWSPDGTRVAFASTRNGKFGIYVKPVDGSSADELIIESGATLEPMSWSPDGKLIVYDVTGNSQDVWAVPVSGDKKPFPLLQSPAAEVFPQVSPDGKWMAFQSNESGRAEIYIKPFPDGPGKWQVSTDGGQYPRWRRDGQELYFYYNNTMGAAAIRVIGSSLEPGAPRALFGVAGPSLVGDHPPYNRYAVSADGQRFLVSQAGAGTVTGGGLAGTIADQVDRSGGAGTAAANAVTVVLNWPQMLKEK